MIKIMLAERLAERGLTQAQARRKKADAPAVQTKGTR